MALWKVVEEQYDAQYVLKVDDDNYVRLDRLAIALDQWTEFGAGDTSTSITENCRMTELCHAP